MKSLLVAVTFAIIATAVIMTVLLFMLLGIKAIMIVIMLHSLFGTCLLFLWADSDGRELWQQIKSALQVSRPEKID